MHARHLLAGLLLVLASPGAADVVVPSDRVSTGVNVRERATSQSPAIGLLRPGEQLEFVGSVPGWHEVELSDGRHGFVSKGWTRIVAGGAPGEVILYAADVGTGLALYVRGPDFALIYDGGSNDDLALGTDNRFLAFLRLADPELTTIDHVVVSHPHRDHVEYLADILGAYEVHHVWDSGAINNICGYRAFLSAIASEATASYHSATNSFGTHTVSFPAKTCYGQSLPAKTLQLVHGNRIDETPIPLGAGAEMTFLHADGTNHTSFNENSLVVRLDLGPTRVLLMGDAEAGGRLDPATPPADHSIEGILLECCAEELAADVLVVGHHGSKTSSRTAFLDAVGAEFYVISSGPMKYGSVTLPDQVIVDELSTRGDVFRTDRDDAACAATEAKMGPGSDGKAGGCDNVRVTFRPDGSVQTEYWNLSE